MKGAGLQFIRGGQIFMYSMRMMIQVLNRIFVWAVLGYIITVAIMLLATSYFEIKVFYFHYYSKALDLIGFGKDVVWTSSTGETLTALDMLTLPDILSAFKDAKSLLIHNLILSTMAGGVLYIGIVISFYKFFIKKGEKYSKNKFISGTTLAKNPKETVRSVEKSKRGASNIKLLKTLPFPLRSESQGIFFHGSTGTGKTQAIMTLLEEIRILGEPAIIYDKECTIKPYFFDETKDVELNPVSEKCANWDLWAECENPLELGNASAYLIPKSVQGSDPFWVDSARTILTSMAWKIKDWDDKSVLKLLQLLLTTSLDDMRDILHGTESENLVSKEIEKTAISIKSVLATYTKSLRFLEGIDSTGKPKFSIKQWIHDAADESKTNKGWLFITSRSQYHKEIKPLVSLWLGLAMQGLQSLKPNSNRRIWLIMDELASLHRLEMLSDTMADIRKFGGCVAVGIQSVSQLQFLYGNHEADAITDLLNTKVFFRSPTNKVAKWVSNDLGEQVVDVVKESQSYGPNSIRDGNTVGSQREVRKTVEAGSITTLEDLECYVRLAGGHPIAKIESEYIKREQLVEPLVERKINFDALEKINQDAVKAQLNPNIEDEVKNIKAFEDQANINMIGETEASTKNKSNKKTTSQQIEEQEASIQEHNGF